MKDTIDALELLSEQHDQVLELIERIENSDDPSAREEMFRQVADKIAAHSTIEEKLFYPSAMTDETRDSLLEATEEHLAVKRVLADMLELDVDDEHFDAKLTVLKEEFRHHSKDEEEGKLFKVLRREMDRDTLAGLGNELLAMYEQLIYEEPRMTVPSQTREAAPLEMMA